ncbi:hypothetical protein [Actinoplanes solisilvae]|uniref:hypothetical protein n=1 Tax=Actinoplanes solisilvae TaxID=2486853 RepID=UPI001F0BD1DB|nr:hypothetical protein [Actinoplanes solisilvae]
MFTVNGLPAHVLLVHAVVVLLPVSALILAPRRCGPPSGDGSPASTPSSRSSWWRSCR